MRRSFSGASGSGRTGQLPGDVVGEVCEGRAIGGDAGDRIGTEEFDAPGAMVRLSGVGAVGAADVDGDLFRGRCCVDLVMADLFLR